MSLPAEPEQAAPGSQERGGRDRVGIRTVSSPASPPGLAFHVSLQQTGMAAEPWCAEHEVHGWGETQP